MSCIIMGSVLLNVLWVIAVFEIATANLVSNFLSKRVLQ